MQRIPQLPKWCLTNMFPAFHDYESLSAIDQTNRLYETMQGLIDDYNKFANEINKTIEIFINNLNGDQKEFECEITRIIHDYIITIDAKIAHQDREIQENIAYIKENIGGAVTDVIRQMKESGELTEELTKAFEDVGARVTSLETSNTETGARVTELETANTNMDMRVSELETEKTNINTRLTVLENIKFSYNAENEELTLIKGGNE